MYFIFLFITGFNFWIFLITRLLFHKVLSYKEMPTNKLILLASQCDLLDMPAVAQLERDGKYALVYRLLQIFLTQRLDSYLEFQAANSALLKSYGISLDLGDNSSVLFHVDAFWLFKNLHILSLNVGLVHEDCITKMRLLSLADLASKGSGEISYASVRDTLRVICNLNSLLHYGSTFSKLLLTMPLADLFFQHSFF